MSACLENNNIRKSLLSTQEAGTKVYLKVFYRKNRCAQTSRRTIQNVTFSESCTKFFSKIVKLSFIHFHYYYYYLE